MSPTRMALPLLALVLLLLVAGCGESAPSRSADTEQAAGQGAGVVTRQDGVVTVHMTGDDRMRYNIDTFTVRPGETVRLVFEHVGEMPVTTMGHNVAILHQGEDAQQFASQVMAEGGSLDNGYLPASMTGRVLAHTAMLGGGEKDVIEFTAPPPGAYPYLCTFPGHFVFMHGQMIVQ